MLSCGFGFAQSNKQKKADQLYSSYQYAEAIDAYNKLATKSEADDNLFRKLADSYYMLAHYKEASSWYAKIGTITDPETYFRYAQSLLATGNTSKAMECLKEFSKLAPSDLRAIEYLKNPNYLAELQNETSEITLSYSNLNSKDASDFSAILSPDDKVFFVSNREGGRNDSWSNSAYVSIYTADLQQDGSYSNIEILKELNSKYHDGPVTISSDGKVIFFARDGHASKSFKKDKKDQVKIGQQGIYKAINENGVWREIGGLPFNSKEYSVSHPSLSPDGKTLYFSSDMPGGYGSSDLWKVSVNADGSYGTPVNLGSEINTPGREVFPFISDNEELYFSSDGHLGMGGLDIFKVNLKRPKHIINLGLPTNSNQDDFGYSVQGELAYISSSRSGSDKIYEATVFHTIDIQFLIVDATNNTPLSDVEIVWKPLEDSSIQSTLITDANGIIKSSFRLDDTYILYVRKPGYEDTEYPLEVNNSSTLHTIKLNEIVKEKEKAPIVFDDIYFDFDSFLITKAASSDLDEVVRILKEDNSLKITIRSHTDAIGSNEYNQSLSERRAKATQDYIVAKGIDVSRIHIEGVGSNDPKVSCDGPCSNEERAQNRRSQIIIK